MALSMYQLTVPAFVRGLKVMSASLKKAEAHVEQHGSVPDAMISARLADDMLPLTGQVQRASDTSKMTVERLTGVPAPKFEDNETSVDQLQQRIANTIAFLESLPQADIDGSETRAITTGSGEKTKHFTGQTYLFHYALPHFFFHATTAYDILRHNGIEVGKKDFIGSY